MHAALDALDLRILKVLQEDGSLSATDLSGKVNISQSQCWRRMQRLREEGYIKHQVFILDRSKLGLNTQIFTWVKLVSQSHTNVTKFSDAVRKIPEILECHAIMGSADFLLRIVVPSVEAYERFFFNNLSHLPNVQEIRSSVVFSEIKSTTVLPLSSALAAGNALTEKEARNGG